MPPAPKKVKASAFPTWDELVAEAHVDIPPYELPLPEIRDDKGEVVQEAEVIKIPVLDGGQFVSLSMWQQAGNASQMLMVLFPSTETRAKVLRALSGAHFAIVDLITTKVIRHFYGLDVSSEHAIETDEDGGPAGKSDAA